MMVGEPDEAKAEGRAFARAQQAYVGDMEESGLMRVAARAACLASPWIRRVHVGLAPVLGAKSSISLLKAGTEARGGDLAAVAALKRVAVTMAMLPSPSATE